MPKTHRQFSRKLYQMSRWLHIYVSAGLFGLLIFFCITGLVLNHPNWMKQTAQVNTFEHTLPESLQLQLEAATEQQAQQLLGAHLQGFVPRAEAKNVEWYPEDNEAIFDYSLPAGYALATVDLQHFKVMFEVQTGGMWQLLGDLHMGRHSGVVWSWIIDLSAVLMVIFALTGLVLLFQNRPKRQQGFVTALLGIVTPVLIFLVFVPAFSGG